MKVMPYMRLGYLPLGVNQVQLFFSDPRFRTGIIVNNLEREEDISKQSKPLDASIHAEIIKFSAKANKDSLEEVVLNVIAPGKFLG